jgi:hypothetical protein
MLKGVESDLQQVRKNSALNSTEKIKQILILIIGRLEDNRRLLVVSMDYLFFLAKSGSDPETRVRRRTVRMRHILASIMIDGMQAGEIRPVNVHEMDSLLYGLIEAAIFRLVVLRCTTVEELKKAVELAISQIRTVVNNPGFCNN